MMEQTEAVAELLDNANNKATVGLYSYGWMATEAEAALEMEDLLHSAVSSGFGGRPEAMMTLYSDGQAAAEAGGDAEEGGSPQQLRFIRIKLNCKEKEKTPTTLGT
ncbi:uncharacterized protein [Lolium perenne]|uniref:uncharacterized protein isoform X1 n=1 Tax=Lolium perenne TaxID=4522 RepID=UPI003A9A3CA9